MPNMGRPVQQRRQVEYAAKADVEVLAAEVRGHRESTKADVQVLSAEMLGFREAVDARLNTHDQALDRIERRLERLSADHRATVRWIIGSALALGGLFLTILRFGRTGIG